MNEIGKDELLNAMKYGNVWYAKRIKNELETMKDSEHAFGWDSDDKFYFIYVNDCYLFIEDGLLTARSDRENVFSANVTAKFPINSVNDIRVAYEKFKAMVLEEEE